MTKRKRLQNTDGDPDDERPRLRKSSRLAEKPVSTEGSSKTMPRFNDDNSRGRSGSSGKKSLGSGALVQKVLKMMENKDQAELMLLELMREYSFSFPRLKELLRRKIN